MEDLKLKKIDFNFNKKTDSNLGSNSKDFVRSSYDLPAAIHKELRILCVQKNCKLTDIFREAIEDVLAKYGVKVRY